MALTDGLARGRRMVRRLHELGLLEPRRALAAARNVPTLIGRGPTLGLSCQIKADGQPDATAIVDDHGSLSWVELDRRVNRLAHALTERDVEPGAAVATVLRNGRHQAEAMLACQKLGLVAMPMNTWARRDELTALLARSDPRAVIFDARHADELDGAIPEGAAAIVVGDGAATPDAEAYESVLAAHSPARPVPFASDGGTARIIIHTSGTTGTPKAATRDIGSSGASALLSLFEVVPYRDGDVIVCPAPMFHSFGLLTFSTAVFTGATLILPDAFDPEGTLEAIAEHGATAASFIPVMIRRMLELPEETRSRYDLSSLRIVLTSGSAMPPDLRARATELFGETLYDLYGSTEAGWIAIATPGDVRAAPDSVGRPVPSVEVAILDEDGQPVPRTETGRVCARGTAEFEGYASGEEVDEHAGYLDTGDLGYLDGDGRLHIVGRADDMVVVGGENVYPIEVEAAIEDLDAVEEVAVVGVPDEEYGEVLAAYVVGSLDEDAVRSHCEATLASFKVPRHVEVVDELPRTATGKVLRRDLRSADAGADEDAPAQM